MKTLYTIAEVVFLVLWILALICELLLCIAGIVIILMPEIIAMVSMGTYAMYLYVAKLCNHYFTPKIWLWKIKRWWWFRIKNL